jgi:hypothetical protein
VREPQVILEGIRLRGGIYRALMMTTLCVRFMSEGILHYRFFTPFAYDFV